MFSLKANVVRASLVLLVAIAATACSGGAGTGGSAASGVKLNFVVAKSSADPGGSADPSVTQTTPPTVNEANIPNVALAPGTSLTINLDTIFDNPNGGNLALSASSSAENVVIASISGCNLTLTAQGPGSATITVSATASLEGGCLDQNQAGGSSGSPVLNHPIPDQALTIADPPVTIDLATVFSTPDGAPLTFSASSSNAAVATASVSGNTLTITPLSPGSATLTAAATDQRGTTVQDSAMVTVTLPDQNPVVTHPIPDQTLTTANPPITIDLTTVFNDPQGEPLTFSATSSNAVVATASVDGNILTITPQSPGSTTVTVVATDSQGLTAQDAVAVTVTNQPPVITNPIPNQSLTAPGSPTTINLSTVFSDPEGGPLTFSASSSSAAAATASVDGNILTITPQSAGSTTVTVVATDNHGATALDAFTVTVTAPQPPVVSHPIPNQTLSTVNPPVTIDLTTVFSDPEGGPLTFSASSSSAAAATASVDGNILTITPQSAGSTTVTVVATDNHGATAQDVFTVTVAPTS